MLSIRHALAALTTVATLATPMIGVSAASAAQTQTTPAKAHGRSLKLQGYRIIIEPKVVESDRRHRGLTTKSITWQLRAVYRDARGNEHLALPATKRRPVKDITVKLNRAWRPSDVRTETRTMRDLGKAKKRFARLIKQARKDMKRRALSRLIRIKKPAKKRKAKNQRKKPMPKLVIGPAKPGPGFIITPKERPAPKRFEHMGYIGETRETHGNQSCREALLNEGHHPMYLDRCAQTEPSCAKALLEAGHHPMHLNQCAPKLSTRCSTTLLKQGHHPQQLAACAGVDDSCAFDLLTRGQHPKMLSYCQGV